MTCWNHNLIVAGREGPHPNGTALYTFRCTQCVGCVQAYGEPLRLSGRDWDPEIVASVRANRAFYLTPGHYTPDRYQRKSFLDLMQDLANAYRRCHEQASAEATERDIRDLLVVLQVSP